MDPLLLAKMMNVIVIVTGLLAFIGALINIFIFFGVSAFVNFFAMMFGLIFALHGFFGYPIIVDQFGFLKHWLGRGIFALFLGFLVLIPYRTNASSAPLVIGIMIVVFGVMMLTFRLMQLPVPPAIKQADEMFNALNKDGFGGVGGGVGVGGIPSGGSHSGGNVSDSYQQSSYYYSPSPPTSQQHSSAPSPSSPSDSSPVSVSGQPYQAPQQPPISPQYQGVQGHVDGQPNPTNYYL